MPKTFRSVADSNAPVDTRGNRLLHLAVAQRDINAINQLLALGANPATANRHNVTPIDMLPSSAYRIAKKLVDAALVLDGHGGDRWYAAEDVAPRSMVIPAGARARMPVKIPVIFEGEPDDERPWRQTVEEALFIMSQRKTPRDNLRRLAALGYTLKAEDGKNFSKSGFLACTDERLKQVIVDYRAYLSSPHKLFLTLEHESTHAIQMSQNKIPISISGLFPPAYSFMIRLATEADAYAHEIQSGEEIKHPDPDGPENQMMFSLPDPTSNYNDFIGAISDPARSLHDGSLIGEAFAAFFSDSLVVLRQHYEWNIASPYSVSNAPLMTDLAEPQHSVFMRHPSAYILSASDIKERLQWRGVSYLGPDIDLSSPECSGMSEVTAERLKEMEACIRRVVPSLKDMPVWDFPVSDYMDREDFLHYEAWWRKHAAQSSLIPSSRVSGRIYKPV